VKPSDPGLLPLQVLGGIISDTQKGFMKGRFMGENTRLLYDLMHYLEENDMDGLLLLIQCYKLQVNTSKNTDAQNILLHSFIHLRWHILYN
jgi:hypothetical protein